MTIEKCRNFRGLAAALLFVGQTLLSPIAHAQAVRVAVPTAAAPVGVNAISAGASVAAPNAAFGNAQLTLSGPALSLPSPILAPKPALPSRTRAAAIGASAQAGPSAVAAPIASASAADASAPATVAAAALASQLAAAPLAAAARRPADGSSARQDSNRSPEAASQALFDGAGKKAQEPKEWTFMVFLNGHNNLDSFGTLNMKQMEKVGTNDRVNIVVQWASLGKPTKRILVQRSESGEVTSPVIESLPAVDMGDAAQLSEFIRWTVERFPAQKYMVDIWNHGSGWRANRKGQFNPLDISYDDNTGHHITTEQLGDVMRKAKALVGHPIDVLGFDACLMAMAEVAAEVADSVRYMAGSEELEPGAGWPYDKVIKQWLAAPADDGLSLVKALTDQFVAAYSRQVTFSALDLAKYPAFAEASKALAKEIAGLDAAGVAALRKAARETRRYGFADYGDFLHLVSIIAKAPAGLLSAPVIEGFTTALRAMVVANGFSADRAGSNGLSVWMPMDAGLWKTYGKRYLSLMWNRVTEWGAAAKRLAAGS